MISTTQIKRFRGLNNVADPVRLRQGWLTKADNVDISSTGRLVRRDGYTQVMAGALSSGYSTRDFSRLFVVDNTALKVVRSDLTTLTIKSGLTPKQRMHWSEINREVYYSNGVDKGFIGADNQAREWTWPVPAAPNVAVSSGALPAGLYQVVCTYVFSDGRETGSGDVTSIQLADNSSLVITDIPQVAGFKTRLYIAPANSAQFQVAFPTVGSAATWVAGPDSLGMNLTTMSLSPPPAAAKQIAFFQGRVYTAEYMPAEDTTVVWFSRALSYHLFDLEQDFFLVRGRCTALAAHAEVLVIGTTSEIFTYDAVKLDLVADYGMVDGWGFVIDDSYEAKPLLVWTTRGLCSFSPAFKNLTSDRVSVAPGVQAGAAVINLEGTRRCVVTLQKGNTAFNPRSYP